MKPVAYAMFRDGEYYDAIHPDEQAKTVGEYNIPLYTHPVKEQKCVVKGCENHRNEGGFTGDLCNPCHQFIVNGEGIYSQAYRNTHPVKELTDEEIDNLIADVAEKPTDEDLYDFAKAILKKAQEK